MKSGSFCHLLDLTKEPQKRDVPPSPFTQATRGRGDRAWDGKEEPEARTVLCERAGGPTWFLAVF